MQTPILKQHAAVVNFLARLFDLGVVLLAAYLAFILRFSIRTPIPGDYQLATLLGGVVSMLSFAAFDIYAPIRGRAISQRLLRMLLAWMMITFVLTLFAFFTKTSVRFSREWMGEWMLIGLLLSWGLRTGIELMLGLCRTQGFNVRRIVIVGAGDLGQRVGSHLIAAKWTGYQILCFMTEEAALNNTTLLGMPVRAIPEDFSAYTRDHAVDEVWIALPLQQVDQIEQAIHQLRFSTANIKVVPDIFGLDLLNHSVVEIAGLPVLAIRATPMEGVNALIKACEDKLISAIILVLVSPLLVVIAIAVKLSSTGPVFYRQERVSWNNKRFMMLKFRSMPMNAEAATGATWAKPGENRATKVGAFLRKTSLDELPQFINVLKGDMSIVGPRPERPVFVEQFKSEIPGYMQKHLVKAGITGWAQVNGWRGSTDLHKRIQYDLYYIEHWSLWFDLRIIALTLVKGFVNKNAY